MSRSLRKRLRRLESKLDSLGADHNSLLQATIRSLEVFNELEGLANRLATHDNNGAASSESAALYDELSSISRDWREILDQRDVATREAFEAVRKLTGSLEAGWSSRFEDLSDKLAKSCRLLVDDHLGQAASSDFLPLRVESSAFGALNPEAGLMSHLYGFLPVATAVDVGACRGEVSRELLDAGYTVYAFEPSPRVFRELRDSLGSRDNCHVFELAVGSANTAMELHLAEDSSPERIYGDAGLYSSLVPHSMPPGLCFAESVSVTVRTLTSLESEGTIPRDIGVLKVDTEGYDLQVLQGLGNLRPHVVAAEFWAPDFIFGQSEAFNRLDEIVKEMRVRGYLWYIVVYRLAGSDKASFYCNRDESVNNSWGNVLFFQDRQIFLRAARWCSVMLPETFLNAANGAQPLQLADSKALPFELVANTEKPEKLAAARERDLSEIAGKLRGIKELQEARRRESADLRRQADELLAAREREIAGLRDQADLLLAARDGEIARLRSNAGDRALLLPQHKAVITQLETNLNNVKLELQSQYVRAKELMAAAKKAQDRARRIKHSWSWKLTAPAREIRRVGVRFGRLLRPTRAAKSK